MNHAIKRYEGPLMDFLGKIIIQRQVWHKREIYPQGIDDCNWNDKGMNKGVEKWMVMRFQKDEKKKSMINTILSKKRSTKNTVPQNQINAICSNTRQNYVYSGRMCENTVIMLNSRKYEIIVEQSKNSGCKLCQAWFQVAQSVVKLFYITNLVPTVCQLTPNVFTVFDVLPRYRTTS